MGQPDRQSVSERRTTSGHIAEERLTEAPAYDLLRTGQVSLARFIIPRSPRQPSLLGGSADTLYYRPEFELSSTMLPRGCFGSCAHISAPERTPSNSTA